MQPTVADRNNNPGNLRDPQTGAFRTFGTSQQGYAALLNDLQGKITGNTQTGLNPNSTLFDFAKTYAPASDNNNPAQYTANLANTLGVRPDTTLGQLQPHIGDFAQAIAKNEGFTEAKGFQASLPIGGDNSLVPTAEASTGQPNNQSDQPWSASGFIGNLANDAGGVMSGLANAVMHPITTAQTVLGTVAGAGEKMVGLQNQDTQMFDNAVQYFKGKYGGDSLSEVVHNIANTAYKDPVSMALDLSTLLDGVGAAVSGVAKVSKIAEIGDAANAIREASGMINPIGIGAKAVGKLGGVGTDIAKSAVSHATGMDVSTVENLVTNPEWFGKTAREEISRGGVLEEVRSGLADLNNLKNETGKGYQLVENSKMPVTLPENFLGDILNKGTIGEDGKAINFGYKLVPVESAPAATSIGDAVKSALSKEEQLPTIQMDAPKIKGMKVVAGTTAKHYDPASVSAIQKFVDRWGDKTELQPAEFLAMRREAAKLGRLGRELGENKGAALVGRSIEGQLNKYGRPQLNGVPGLEGGLQGLDETSAPIIRLSNKVTKDLYNADGSLKDNSASKIANALNKNELMKRLEQVTPGITQRLQALKAVEDIERSMGIKVGTYDRSVGEIFAAATGNVPLVVGMILSHPKVAMQILRGFGYAGKAAIPILGRVRALLGALPEGVLSTAGKLGVISNQIPSPAGNQTPAPVLQR